MASSVQRRKALAVVVLMLLDYEEKSRRKQKNSRVWVEGWIARRQELGAFPRIVRELAETRKMRQAIARNVADGRRTMPEICCAQCCRSRAKFYCCNIARNIVRNNFRGGHTMQFSHCTQYCAQCCTVCPGLY